MPEVTVTIRKVADNQYHAVTQADNGKEITSNLFEFRSDSLLDLEPQWMIERAIPKELAKQDSKNATTVAGEHVQLATYGQWLHRFLFGDGTRLANFSRI